MTGARTGLSLHGFLTRLIWLCVGPLAILAVFMAIERVRDVQVNRDREATALATSLATAVDQDLNARIDALKMLAQSPLGDDAARWRDLYQEAQGFRQSFGSHVILADLNMHMLFNTRAPFGTELPTLPTPGGRAAVPIAMATARPAVGDIFQGPLAKEPLVAVAVPALREGKTAFLLLTVFEAHQFQRHLDQIALPTGWAIALLDGSGKTIARRAPAVLDPSRDVDASGRFVVKSVLSPWSVALEIPRDIYRAPIRDSAAALALAILGATLTGVVGGTLAGSRLGRCVASLAQAPAAGAGSSGIFEIDRVQRLLDDAARRREAAEATLLVSEQRFRRLFYEAPLPQALISMDGAIVGLNARFVQVFGYGIEDVPTVSDWWPRAYPDPDYRARVVEDWDATIARSGTTTNVEPVERRVSCKNGVVRSMLVSGIAVGDDFLCAFFDVTERKQAEEARERLAAIVESSDDAIVSSTVDGVITSWNQGAERTFGFSPEETIGRPVREIIRCKDDDSAREQERRIFHSRRGPRHAGAEEVVRLHRDGHSMTLSIVTGVIRDASGKVSALAAIMRDITVAKRRDGELQALVAEQGARDRQMRDLTARLRTLREEECTRISREVHDGLGQLLTCLKMDIRWMARRLAGGAPIEDVSAKLAETEVLVDQTVESVQRIAIELRPSALDALGLPAAIRDEARRFEARTGVATVVDTSAASSPEQPVATTLFRILQELLTNIARHAQASLLSIRLTNEQDGWELRVRDDGIGIPSGMLNRSTSLGLLGMTERAEAVGGSFSIERHPEGGTLAIVRLPHPPASRIGHESHTDR
jgi:PAS domain S-box-containing protein